MNLIEAFKQIGRDIKSLTTRTDSVERNIEELKKTGPASSDSTPATDLEQIKQDILDLKTLKYFERMGSWINDGSGKPHVWKELEEATGDVGTPYANLPFYLLKNKGGGLILFGLDTPPYTIDPETKAATWTDSGFEWANSIDSLSVLGFELLNVSEDNWESYNEFKNKGEGNERRLVSRTFGDPDKQGLWYVDDDGHFQRLVDTVIDLKKEIETLKGKQNHE